MAVLATPNIIIPSKINSSVEVSLSASIPPSVKFSSPAILLIYKIAGKNKNSEVKISIKIYFLPALIAWGEPEILTKG